MSVVGAKGSTGDLSTSPRRSRLLLPLLLSLLLSLLLPLLLSLVLPLLLSLLLSLLLLLSLSLSLSLSSSNCWCFLSLYASWSKTARAMTSSSVSAKPAVSAAVIATETGCSDMRRRLARHAQAHRRGRHGVTSPHSGGSKRLNSRPHVHHGCWCTSVHTHPCTLTSGQTFVNTKVHFH
jgi:hypothetical protein